MSMMQHISKEYSETFQFGTIKRVFFLSIIHSSKNTQTLACTNLELTRAHEHGKHALSSTHRMAPVVIRHIVSVTTSHSEDPLAKTLQESKIRRVISSLG